MRDKEGNQSAMRERKGKGKGVRKGRERWKQDPMIPNRPKWEGDKGREGKKVRSME